MVNRVRKLSQAWLETPLQGVIELARDWLNRDNPELKLSGGFPFASLQHLPDEELAWGFGFFTGAQGEPYFVFFPEQDLNVDLSTDRVFLAGDFNGWQACVGNTDWELQRASFGNKEVMIWAGPPTFLHLATGQRFKFVTDKHHWIEAAPDARNLMRDEQGNYNRQINVERSGRHLFRFTLTAPLDLSVNWQVEWLKDGDSVPLRPDGFFFNLKTELPLGVHINDGETTFRLFAPRASRVDLCITPTLEPGAEVMRYALHRRSEPMEALKSSFMDYVRPQSRTARQAGQPQNWQGAWEVSLDQDLHGWYYWFQVDGPSGPFSQFQKNQRVLDPYAIATVTREGPGIVIDARSKVLEEVAYKTPAWQDLVIAEAHVRDLVQNAPIQLRDDERRGFTGLAKWVRSPLFHLHHLGINCVELQPVHEYDSKTREEYAWGYMPVSWFAPASGYSLDPSNASGVEELQDLVAAFHERGMAVVLDVVFNHQGEPAHLMFLDRHYYFTDDAEGQLSNWSGCGNDFRATSAMARRLIIDSCIHMIKVYGVDGFRFDLAELLGVDVLLDVEKALKTVKRDVILIAEPWSYRGHIAGELACTGWASWNDGYRNFMKDYVRGGGSASQLEYFMKGSPWYFARWPAQTVNYTESHDDRTWIDVITEHGNGNGYHPTELDRRRTQLMTAVLFASLGIPMITAGQDFIRSKHGVNNTYLRGDLNALDYRRAQRFSGTHAYFAEWIAFRLSPQGRLLRQWSCPSEGFFRSFSRPDSTVLALLYNADGTQGPEKLLFAINASFDDKALALDADIVALPWRQIADHERFDVHGVLGMQAPVTPELVLPAMTCSLWRC